MPRPAVALVGRPNVGKSTLFNRLTGERLAIIDETPGTTRDRVFATCEWNGREFTIVDTGGIDPEFGRRTPLSVGSADFVDEIRQQALIAVSEADAVILVVDGDDGITSADREIADLLRRHQKRDAAGQPRPPILVTVNKCETEERRARASEFYALGLGQPQAISALHGTGTGDLLDRLVAGFAPPEVEPEDESVKVAIVGKPNAGKSSLLNKLVGAERAIVSPIPGTTRDAIDTRIEFQGIGVTLIDTAGIRRRGRVEHGVEQYSVLRALKAIERADVALLVIDATTGITAQDAHIAGYILEAWKSCVVLINKWDALQKDAATADEYTALVRRELHFLDYVPVLMISAKTGKGVDRVLPMALRVQEERLVRLSTSKINQVLQKAQDMHAHPSKSGRVVKLYYGTQVRSDPPTFMIYVNDPKLMHFSYVRYLENQLRAEYGFLGTPIRLVTKGRKEP